MVSMHKGQDTGILHQKPKVSISITCQSWNTQPRWPCSELGSETSQFQSLAPHKAYSRDHLFPNDERKVSIPMPTNHEAYSCDHLDPARQKRSLDSNRLLHNHKAYSCDRRNLHDKSLVPHRPSPIHRVCPINKVTNHQRLLLVRKLSNQYLPEVPNLSSMNVRTFLIRARATGSQTFMTYWVTYDMRLTSKTSRGCETLELLSLIHI